MTKSRSCLWLTIGLFLEGEHAFSAPTSLLAGSENIDPSSFFFSESKQVVTVTPVKISRESLRDLYTIPPPPAIVTLRDWEKILNDAQEQYGPENQQSAKTKNFLEKNHFPVKILNQKKYLFESQLKPAGTMAFSILKNAINETCSHEEALVQTKRCARPQKRCFKQPQSTDSWKLKCYFQPPENCDPKSQKICSWDFLLDSCPQAKPSGNKDCYEFLLTTPLAHKDEQCLLKIGEKIKNQESIPAKLSEWSVQGSILNFFVHLVPKLEIYLKTLVDLVRAKTIKKNEDSPS